MPAQLRRLLIATWALCLAVWFLLPGRNVHGDARFEELLTSCTTEAGVTVRLYKGREPEGEAVWISVTSEGGFARPQRQVLYALEAPLLDTLACTGNGARLTGGPRIELLSQAQLESLRGEPRTYWRGARTGQGTQPRRMAQLGIAGVFALIGAAQLVALWRRRERRGR
jgi:hypothetical protein